MALQVVVSAVYAAVDGCRIEGRLDNHTERHKEIWKIFEAIRGSIEEFVSALLASGKFGLLFQPARHRVESLLL